MSDDEIVIIVDETNECLGSAPRHRMRAERLIHRATYIFVFNPAGELFVQKRTAIKDMYPDYYDLAAGGVVLYEESYEESARREAQEELGITGTTLQSHFDFYYEDEHNRIWGRIFSCIYDGELVLQPEEIESGEYLSVSAALDGHLAPITPDTLYALGQYMERVSANPSTS